MAVTADGGAPAPFPSPRPRLALGLIAVVQLMLITDTSIVNVALPRLQHDLDLSVGGLSWVVNAYTLSFGGFLLLGGRVGDLLGRRPVFVGGVALFTVASLLGGLAVSGPVLIGARALQGVGAALAAPAALSLIATIFAEGAPRNRALGVYAGMSGAGMALGLVAGGLLTGAVSWRGVFFVNVPFGVAVVLLARRAIPVTPRLPGRFDAVGAVTSTFGAVALVYGFVRVAEEGWSDTVALVALASSAALIGFFVRHESRVDQPIMPLRIFADRRRSGAFAMRMVITAAMVGMMFMLTLFVQDVLDYTPWQTALAFFPPSAAVFLTGRYAPRLFTTRDPRGFLVLGAVLNLGAMVWQAQISPTSTYLGTIFGPQVLFGIGLGLLFVTMAYAALAGVDPSETGAASGMLSSMQQIGGAIGIALMVTVAGRAAVSGSGVDERALAEGITGALDLGIALCAIVLLLAIVQPRTPGPAAAEPQLRSGSGSRTWSRSSEK